MAKQYYQIIVDDAALTVQIRQPSDDRPLASFTVAFEDVGSRETESPDAVVSALEKALSRFSDSACEDAVILVGSGLCFFRQTLLPFKTKSKIRQVLPMSLAPTFPVDDINFISRFEVTALKPEKEQHTIFSASMAQDRVAALLSALEDRAIRPKIMTPLALGVCAVYLKNNPGARDFIIVIPEGACLTAVVVINRQPVRIRTFVAGSGNDGADREIDRMIIGLDQEEPVQFEKIFVRNDLAKSNGNPAFGSFKTVTINAVLAALTPDGGTQNFYNFCNGGFSSIPFLKTYGRRLIGSAVLAAFVFAVFMVSVHSRINGLEAQIEAAKQTKAAIFSQAFPGRKTGGNDPYLVMQSLIKEEEKKRGANRGINGDQKGIGIGAINMLYELSSHIPPAIDVTLVRIVFDPQRLIIDGTAENFNAVDQVKGYIEKSKRFKSVEISNAATQKDGKGVDFKFLIEMQENGTEPQG